MGRLSDLLPRAKRLACLREPGELTDRELLRRFSARREEAAFAELVRRHGPMVLAVCRRLLCREHDAEDSFQATFLVLARKAATIGWGHSIGGWLHEVATRVALKARAASRHLPATEGEMGSVSDDEPLDEASRRELTGMLDEELQRLPRKYRSPIVLCYLEGKSNVEAARELGWTKGTVSGRLARARALLRRRLQRRGVALSVAVLLGTLAEASAAAPVPDGLAQSASTAAAGGSVNTAVAALVQSVLSDMLLTGLRASALGVLVWVGLAGLSALGGGLAASLMVSADRPAARSTNPLAAPERLGPPGTSPPLSTADDREPPRVQTEAISLRGEPPAHGGGADLPMPCDPFPRVFRVPGLFPGPGGLLPRTYLPDLWVPPPEPNQADLWVSLK